MMHYVKLWYNRVGTYVHTPYADIILGFLFYLEAIIFLPTDPLLAIYCLEKKERALVYATIATFASVLGGITTYAIGVLLWNTVGSNVIHNPYMHYIITPERFESLSLLYKEHSWIALLIAGIPPIPYKAVTLAAGFCKIPLLPFIVCSCIIRGLRFYGLALVLLFVSDTIKLFISRYFMVITTSIVITLVYFIYRLL